MNRTTRKRFFLVAGGVVLLALLVWGFLPEPLDVETAVVGRGSMEVVVEEEGETQAEDRFVIASPTNAVLRRIELEVGDSVGVGDPVAFLEPPSASALDPRSRSEAEARIESARAALRAAEERARAADIELRRATAERERIERLHATGSATRQALEAGVAAAETAAAEKESAAAQVEAAKSELAAARAAVQEDGSRSARPGVLRSPVSGRVLAVHQVSAGPVSAGQPLVDVGDTRRLEVRVDVLSEDAVRIHPGTRVLLEDWGGEGPLDAAVTRVDPQGFTEISSLGVEEKRVGVVAALLSPPDARTGLGVGYRVLARFVVWEGTDVLQAPAAALFRRGDGWSAFVVEGGRAVLRSVEIGQQGTLVVQVLSGLEEGDRVIVHPPNDTADGSRVAWEAEG